MEASLTKGKNQSNRLRELMNYPGFAGAASAVVHFNYDRESQRPEIRKNNPTDTTGYSKKARIIRELEGSAIAKMSSQS